MEQMTADEIIRTLPSVTIPTELTIGALKLVAQMPAGQAGKVCVELDAMIAQQAKEAWQRK